MGCYQNSGEDGEHRLGQISPTALRVAREMCHLLLLHFLRLSRSHPPSICLHYLLLRRRCFIHRSEEVVWTAVAGLALAPLRG